MTSEIIRVLSEGFDKRLDKMAALNEASFTSLNEAILTKMFEAIGDKYNEIDFSEIEKSKGNFNKFKYKNLLVQNCELLNSLYAGNSDPSVRSMVEYTKHASYLLNRLSDLSSDFELLYSVSAPVAIIYNTTVANLIYSITLLLSMTVRFVTVDKNSDIEVIIDTLPSADKHLFIANLPKLAKAYEKDVPKLLEDTKANMKKNISESYDPNTVVMNELSTAVTIGIIAAGSILVLTKLVFVIREVIYSIYNARISIENALEYQIDLLSANIEMLEDDIQTASKDHKKKYTKVVAKQRRIVEKMDKIKRVVSIKFDVASNGARKEIARENRQLNIDTRNKVVSYDSEVLI